MPNVTGAYCAVEDLRLGDIRPQLPPEQYIKSAAEEIDAALGSLYVTPIIIPELVENRPAILTLKKINYLLASGRAILDMNASGENTQQHAYGMGMLKEGLAMLKLLVNEDMRLVGAALLNPVTEASGQRGPQIFNEDPESLVEAFYRRGADIFPGSHLDSQANPYGFTRRW